MVVNVLRGLQVAAHKYSAIVALRDVETPSRRLARYNHHMSKARSLEVQHG